MSLVRDKLAGILPALNSSPKAREIMRVLPRTICFDLEGEGGPFCIVVTGEEMALRDKVAGEPDIVISGDAAEMARIVTREREITHPVAEGKVWVSKGKLSQMILFDRVLALQAKQPGKAK